jgi:IclR family acetate operon transcriptional repressor
MVKNVTRIRSVSKAVAILMHVATTDGGTTARQTSEALAIPVATAYHLLDTLVAEGLLVKDSRRLYHLGPKVGVLSDAFLRRGAVPEYLLTPLNHLAESTGETAYLSGWQHDEVVVLASVEGSHAVRVKGLHPGFAGYTHARASGKLFLAFAPAGAREAYLDTHRLEARTPHTIVDQADLRAELDRIRSAGYAVDREEFTLGVTCVSAPVIENGVVVAAYTLAAPTDRFDRDRDALVRAAAAAAERVATRAVPA